MRFIIRFHPRAFFVLSPPEPLLDFFCSCCLDHSVVVILLLELLCLYIFSKFTSSSGSSLNCSFIVSVNISTLFLVPCFGPLLSCSTSFLFLRSSLFFLFFKIFTSLCPCRCSSSERSGSYLGLTNGNLKVQNPEHLRSF